MVGLTVFAAVSGFLLYVSRKSLFLPRSHGFWRFFAWESILALLLLNLPRWFDNPFGPLQIVSWLLLLASILLVVDGVRLLKRTGKPGGRSGGDELLAFEKTSTLVTSGVYRYIRHPLYASLLTLAWGAFLKDPTLPGAVLAGCASLFLYLTALRDEEECLAYFGDAYRAYMLVTKRFVPFLF